MRKNFGAKPWSYPQPITFDPIHSAYRKLGEKVGNAFQDGARLK